MQASIELDFADGKYLFALKLPQALELERKCGTQMPDGTVRGKSIFTIYEQLGDGLGRGGDGDVVFVGGGSASVTDIREVLRLGLIGGGSGLVNGEVLEVSPIKALQIVDAYTFPARPLSESLGTAWAVLHAAIVGIDLKKKPESVTTKPNSKTRNRSAKAS